MRVDAERGAMHEKDPLDWLDKTSCREVDARSTGRSRTPRLATSVFGGIGPQNPPHLEASPSWGGLTCSVQLYIWEPVCWMSAWSMLTHGVHKKPLRVDLLAAWLLIASIYPAQKLLLHIVKEFCNFRVKILRDISKAYTEAEPAILIKGAGQMWSYFLVW
jgi:hypothetical protein